MTPCMGTVCVNVEGLAETLRFSVERLRVAVKRMLNDVPNRKRKGKAVSA